MLRHGRRYFEEFSHLTAGDWGNMRDVLAKIDELFLTLTVTVHFTLLDRLSECRDRFTLRQVPMVIRLH